MRIPTSLLAVLLSLGLLLGACRDDDTPVATGDGQGDEPSATTDVPDRPADLTGTITSVESFEPVTEDCTPPEDLDPDGAVSDEDPPICTPAGNDIVGTILVEERPDAPEEGRKVSYTVFADSVITGTTAGGAAIEGFGDLASGQPVETWIPADGACAESYPEQCGLEALRVTG
jgi:hypothetical protein